MSDFLNNPAQPPAQPLGVGTPNDDILDIGDIPDEELKEKVIPDQEGKPKEAKKEEKELKEPKETDEEEQLVEPEAEEDEVEEPVDELKELSIVPARKKEILAKYPNLFKDFPILEHSLYKSRQFTEVFATPQDAKDALDRIESFDRYQDELLSGNTESILKAMKDDAPESFGKIVDNYLVTLQKVDRDAYHHVLGNYAIKPLLISMAQTAQTFKTAGQDDVADRFNAAAQLIHQFVFGTPNFQPIQTYGRQQADDQTRQLQEQQQQFIQQRYDTVNNDMYRSASNRIRATIDANIDPNERMSPYVRQKAVEEAFSLLEETVYNDREYRAINDKLWDAAFKSNFNPQSTERVKSAYLTRSKIHLPGIIKHVRDKAIKGTPVNRPDRDRKGPLPQGRSSSQSSNRGKTAKEQAAEIPRNMSTHDFLMKD